MYEKQTPCVYFGRFGRLGMTLYLGMRVVFTKGQIYIYIYIYIYFFFFFWYIFGHRPNFFFVDGPTIFVNFIDWVGSSIVRG